MDLRNDIARAFESRPFPKGSLFSTDRTEGAEELFWYGSWARLGGELLGMHTAVLNFLSNEGLCYLLPAFMLAALEQPNSGVADSVVEKLLPPKGNALRPSYRAWSELLSQEQKRAVVQFLRHMGPFQDQGLAEAADALEAQWLR